MITIIFLLESIGLNHLPSEASTRQNTLRPMAASISQLAELLPLSPETRQELVSFVKKGIFTNQGKPPFSVDGFTVILKKKLLYLTSWMDRNNKQHEIALSLNIKSKKKPTIVKVSRFFLNDPPIGIKPQWLLAVETPGATYIYRFNKKRNHNLERINLDPTFVETDHKKKQLIKFIKERKFSDRNKPPFSIGEFTVKAANGYVNIAQAGPKDKLFYVNASIAGLKKGDIVTVGYVYMLAPKKGLQPQWLLKLDTPIGTYLYKFTRKGSHLRLIERVLLPTSVEKIKEEIIDFAKKGIYNDKENPPFSVPGFNLKAESDYVRLASWYDRHGKQHSVLARIRGIKKGELVEVSCLYNFGYSEDLEPQWVIMINTSLGRYYYIFSKERYSYLEGLEIEEEDRKISAAKSEMVDFAKRGVFNDRENPPCTLKSFKMKITGDDQVFIGGWRDNRKKPCTVSCAIQGLKKNEEVTITPRYCDRKELPAGMRPQWLLEISTISGVFYFKFVKSGTRLLRYVDLSPQARIGAFVKRRWIKNPNIPPFLGESFNVRVGKNGSIYLGSFMKNGKSRSVMVLLKHLPEGHIVTVKKLFNTDGQWLIMIDTHHSYSQKVYYYVTPRNTLNQWRYKVGPPRPDQHRTLQYFEIIEACDELRREDKPASLNNIATKLKIDINHLRNEISRMNRMFYKYPGAPHIKLMPQDNTSVIMMRRSIEQRIRSSA